MESIIKSSKVIKNEYKDENGILLAKSNITFPEMTKEFDSVSALYSDVADNFEKYIKRVIVKKASAKAKNESFVPFGCVLKYVNTFEDERYLSIILDSHTFDGKRKSVTVRLSQVWSKDDKRIMSFRDFYKRSDRDRLVSFFTEEALKRQSEGTAEYKDNIESLIISKTDFSRFYLVKDGIAFYFAPHEISENDYPDVFTDKREIN